MIGDETLWVVWVTNRSGKATLSTTEV